MSTTDFEGSHRARVYLAAPLFSEAERSFNIRVTGMLEEAMEVYLPQRDGGLMSEMVSAGVPSAIAGEGCQVPFSGPKLIWNCARRIHHRES
jgi:hypothetical protein